MREKKLTLLAGVGLMLTCAQAACANSDQASRRALEPPDGSSITTPLSAVLKWTASPGAAGYRVTIRARGRKKPVVAAGGVTGTSYRVALRPDTAYRWTVTAVGPDGRDIGTSAPSTFRTAPTTPREITDYKIIFAGVHPQSHWQAMDEIPSDPSAAVSPWFEKKEFDDAPPPTCQQVKDRLPRPVFEDHQDLIDMYWYAWDTLFSVWLFAPKSQDSMAVSNLIGLPSWGPWGSTMVWDTAFILQFARYGHWAYPFITGLDNCYARQHENGFICRESDSNNREVYVIYPANPPLLAWAEWQYYNVTGDVGRLSKVFLPLVKQYEWYMLYQRRADGLYWTNTFQEADDSPRNPYAHSVVSTTSIQAMTAGILADMAKLVGRDDMSGWFGDDAKHLKSMVNSRFWDSEHQLYNDLNKGGAFITDTPEGGIIKHVHMFWPLLAGIATPERAQAMAEHLADPKQFNRSSGTASLSADSRDYNWVDGNYWRGSVWPPTQYMVIKGLETCGSEELASLLAHKYVSTSVAAFKACGDIHEFLAPDKPEMRGCGKFVGWGGLAPIAILFEDIMGIRVDAPSNSVTWRLRRTERHGVENLRFGERTVSLICERRASVKDPCKLSIDSDGEFTLTLDMPGRKVEKTIKKGHADLVVED